MPRQSLGFAGAKAVFLGEDVACDEVDAAFLAVEHEPVQYGGEELRISRAGNRDAYRARRTGDVRS